MAGISAMGTIYNLPNYHGIIYQITPNDTPFFSAIGGLTGGKSTLSTEFSWQTFDLPSAAQPAILEGADPSLGARVRAEIRNVVQIFQYGIKLSYTKMSAPNNYGTAGASSNPMGVGGNNPVNNEMSWQVQQVLKTAARDIEYSFINGAYQLPANNSTARKTKGMLAAITSNVVDASSAPLSETHFKTLLKSIWDGGGIQEQDTAYVYCNSTQKEKISEIYAYAPQDRNVGGVDINTIETDFGRLNVVLNRYVPQDTILVASIEACAPVFLMVVEDGVTKGFLFEEPLAKTGAAATRQIYGEIGLEYGYEGQHGKIIGLATS